MSHLLLDRPKQVVYSTVNAQALTGSTWQKLRFTTQTNLITNGHFETDLSGWTTSGNVVRGSLASLGIGSGWSAGVANFNSGNTTPNGVLSQSFSGISGQSITLAFNWGKYGTAAGSQILLVEIVRPDSTVLYTTTLTDSVGAITSALFKFFSAAVTLDQTGTHTLRFTDQSTATSSQDLLLDNVQLYVNTVPGYLTELDSTFTCVVPGRYYVQVQITNQTTNREAYIGLWKNGSQIREVPPGTWALNSLGFIQNTVIPVDLAVGDTVEAYGYSTGGSSTLYTTASFAPVSLRVFFAGGAGPNVARPTHQKLLTVKTSGQSISNSVYNKCTMDAASVNTANFTDSSDTFTASIPGLYAVFWQFYTTVGDKGVCVYRNGAIYATSGGSNYHNQCFCLVELAVGDTLEFYVFPTSTTGLVVSECVAEVVLL